MTTPFETVITRLSRPSKPFVSKAGASVRACCPACGGDNRSKLIVTEKPGGGVLIHCFAGCDPLSVLHAVDLDFTDLFADQKRSRPLRADARHDQHMLAGMAVDVISEVQHLLLLHIADPRPWPEVAEALTCQASELAQIQEFLKKENKHGK